METMSKGLAASDKTEVPYHCDNTGILVWLRPVQNHVEVVTLNRNELRIEKKGEHTFDVGNV